MLILLYVLFEKRTPYPSVYNLTVLYPFPPRLLWNSNVHTVPEKSIPTPWKVIGNSQEEGVLPPKVLEAKYEVKLEFLGWKWGGGGGEGGKQQKPSMGEYGCFLELHNNILILSIHILCIGLEPSCTRG